MPRPEKVQAVADIKERIEGAQAVFLAEYAGLSVKDQQTLRRELRANGAEFKVVKMTLARRATDELEINSLDELLLGPTGLAFADGDPAGAAKVLRDFAKSHDTFMVKGGLLGVEFLSPESIAELADIEPREVLLAKIAGVMQAPMSNLAGLLAALPRNTASVLKQLLEQKEASEVVEVAEDALVEAADVEEAEEAVEVTEALEDASGDDDSGDAEAADDDADDAPASKDDASGETEDDSKATPEASDDAGDETDEQPDDASQDDVEQE